MSNQANEDELQKELERLYKCVVYDLIDDVDRKELWIKEVGIVVKALIRTEKLKLLEEVREMVGMDVKCDGTCRNVVCDLHSHLEKLQLELLNKLEAGL